MSTISNAIDDQIPAWAGGLSFRLPGRVSRDVAIPRLKSNVFLLFIYVWLRWGIPKFSLIPKQLVVGLVSMIAGKETGQSADHGLRFLGLLFGGLILYNIAEAYISLRYPLPSSKPPQPKRKSLAPSAPGSPLNTPTAMTAAQRRLMGTPKVRNSGVLHSRCSLLTRFRSRNLSDDLADHTRHVSKSVPGSVILSEPFYVLLRLTIKVDHTFEAERILRRVRFLALVEPKLKSQLALPYGPGTEPFTLSIRS
ncbi:hypothetical protein FRB90_002108, partial [Tulasnella sp. 427]